MQKGDGMFKTIVLDNIDDVMKVITEQTYNPQIKRIRSSYFYRGVRDANYKTATSLYRNCRNLKKELEPAILRAFTKYACIEDPSLCDSVWKQMIIGQHHGLPTRLLDWTYSPLIALHFATSEDNLDKVNRRDCVLWRMDMEKCNSTLPRKYRDVLEKEHSLVFTVDMLNQLAPDLEKYDADMGTVSAACIEPPSVDQRIVSQYSFFSVIPSGITDIETFFGQCEDCFVRFVIKKELRWHIRDLLDQFNVNERTLLPGLDGLSRLLGRHYYVGSGIPMKGETE